MGMCVAGGKAVLCGASQNGLRALRCGGAGTVLLAALALAGGPVACGGGPGTRGSEAVYQRAREAMVAQQLVARGIQDAAVLRAMGAVRRHRYVRSGDEAVAYTDQPLAIGEGQTISQPYIVALMTELLEVRPGDRVLEVGTGSGYQAAVLAELGTDVFTIEILPGLATRAEARLRAEGYPTVAVRVGDGYLGWPEVAPFDAILVTAAPDHVPAPLIEQLRDGGRLVIPVGEAGGVQALRRLRRRGAQVESEEITAVRFVPLVHP